MPRHETHREVAELSSVIESKAFRTLLTLRKDYLQKEVNRFVREQNIVQAYGALAKMDDIDKTIEIAIKRINELKKEE